MKKLIPMVTVSLKKAPGVDKKHWAESSNKWDQLREEINRLDRVNS